MTHTELNPSGANHTKSRISPAHRTLVLGFDFTDAAELALDQSLELARSFPEVTLHVVWIAQFPLATLDMDSRPLEHEALAERLKSHIAERSAKSHQGGGDERGYGDSVAAIHVATGNPARVLTEFAFLEGADLIVVGTHHRTGLQRLLLGSVAADVVTMAPCPVLIARPKAKYQLPRIEPARKDSPERSLGKRHTHHIVDRNAQARENAPLVFPLY